MRQQGSLQLLFDQEKGVLVTGKGEDRFAEAPGAVGLAEIRNPSYLTLSADGRYVYAVREVADSTASAATLSLDRNTGAMQLIGNELTDGKDPCYISTNGKVVMTANYSSGNVTEFPVGDDGALKPHDFLYRTGLGGPDSTRQNLPHAHCALFNAAGTELYVSEFSADVVARYDVATRQCRRIQLPSDFGPRHIVLNDGEDKAYVIGELSGSIAVIDTESDRVVQTVCADTVNARGSADIHFLPTGGSYMPATGSRMTESRYLRSMLTEHWPKSVTGTRVFIQGTSISLLTESSFWSLAVTVAASRFSSGTSGPVSCLIQVEP